MEEPLGQAGNEVHVVTFQMERDWIGIPVEHVLRIEPLGRFPVTRMPRVPDMVEGIINYRGEIVPLINARRLFGLDRRPYSEDTSVVMVANGEERIGFVVDEIPEAHVLPTAEMEDFSKGRRLTVEPELIQCLCKKGDHLAVVLEVGALLRQLDVTAETR